MSTKFKLTVFSLFLSFIGLGCYHLLSSFPASSPRLPGVLKADNADAIQLVGDSPLVFGVITRAQLPQPKSDLMRCLSGEAKFQLPSFGRPDPSLCLHLIKLLGWDGTLLVGEGDEQEELLLRELIFDGDLSKKYLGDAAFTETRFGIRFPTKVSQMGHAADESHRDQCLAMLAENGVKLSRELSFQGKTYELRDVLCDSIANFHLEQKELAWSTVAYASYLPPISRWQNRYGMEFSFDDLARAMMDRPRDQLSCGGTHVYYALTVLLRADRESPILSEETRSELFNYLHDAIKTACRRQKSDGTWEMQWWRERSGDESPQMSASAQVLITGHMAEWLMHVPEDLLVSDYVIRRAGVWLAGHLADADETTFWKEVCPYTHALFVVQP